MLSSAIFRLILSGAEIFARTDDELTKSVFGQAHDNNDNSKSLSHVKVLLMLVLGLTALPVFVMLLGPEC